MNDVAPVILAHGFHADLFLNTWPILCGPVLIGGMLVIRAVARKAADDMGRGLGLWATGLLAAVVGFLDPALWLTWSGYRGSPLDASLPAPNQFPQWQIIGLAVTFFVPIVVLALKMRRPITGAFALGLGAAIGSATAMTVDVSFVDVVSQEGIGVAIALVGVGIVTLGVGLIIGLARGLRAGLKWKSS